MTLHLWMTRRHFTRGKRRTARGEKREGSHFYTEQQAAPVKTELEGEGWAETEEGLGVAGGAVAPLSIWVKFITQWVCCGATTL